MDDQQWNWFLTPSSTPTDATFSPASLQTPRTTTHFQDAFSPYINHDSISTPHASNFDRQQAFGQENMQAAFHGQTSINHSHQSFHGQHPSFDMTAQENFQNKHPEQTSFSDFPESFQIQTPPPTRDQSSRRKSRTQSVVFGAPSNMLSRDHTADAPHAPSQLQHHQQQSQQQQQPQFHQRLQNSMSQPVLSQFTNFAQMPEPSIPMPQENAYWPSSISHNNGQEQPNWNSLDDPFHFQPQFSSNNPIVPSQKPQQQHRQYQQTVPSNAPPRQVLQNTASGSNIGQITRPISQSSDIPNMMTTAAGVNPNLLYSSPNRFMSASFDTAFSPEQQTSFDGLLSPNKQSSISFTQGSIERPNSRQQNLLPESQLRPGIRRSHTTGGGRPQSMYASMDSLSRSNSAANIARRPSPLKRANMGSMVSLASIAETPKTLPRSRTSVVLTVDSKGRARAETRVIDASPTKSMKCRYPSLWDDSDSDSDSDKSTQIPGMNSSFSASRTSERQCKVARLDPPLENLEGLNLPRSNSSASMRATPSKAAYAASMQLRRQGSVKRSGNTIGHNRRNTTTSLNRSMTDLSSAAPDRTEDMAMNDAGAALRKAMESRSSQPESITASRQSTRSRTQSSAARPIFPPRTSSLMRSQSSFTLDSAPMIPMSADNSPTKNCPIKPTGELANAMSAITRCICGFPFVDNQLMIQCNSCHLWLHTGCLGMIPHQLPPHYTCTFCATPNPLYAAGRLGWETAAV